MQPIIGFLHESGSPAIDLEISGPFPDVRQGFTAIIDTGFTGFVSMPLASAFPLGLSLFGTSSVVLADGNSQTKLLALCTVYLTDEQQIGEVILEPSSTEVLVGMKFISGFRKTLLVNDRRVALMDADWFETMDQRTGIKPKPGAGPDSTAEE